MSNESYYSPRLTAEAAEQIINECNKIIAKTMTGRKLIDISIEELGSVKPQEVINGVWKEENNSSYKVELKESKMVSYDATISQGEIINYSKLLKTSIDEIKENLDKCIPRTVSEEEQKKSLMRELYEKSTSDSAWCKSAKEFVEKQAHISDAQQEIVDKYFALINLLGIPQEKFSIEAMAGDIDKMQENFVRQEERKYIKDNIHEVFSKHGYNIDVVEWMKEEACDVVYSDIQYAQGKIYSLGDEYLFESYGVIDHEGNISNDERKRIVNDQMEICKRNRAREEELKSRGILLVKKYNYEPAEGNIKYMRLGNTHRNRAITGSIGEETV